jgi:hypothetical protein
MIVKSTNFIPVKIQQREFNFQIVNAAFILYSENCMEPINALCEYNAEFCNAKTVGMHCVQ